MAEILMCRIEWVVDREAAATFGNTTDEAHIPEEEAAVAAAEPQYPDPVTNPDNADVLRTQSYHAGSTFAKTRYAGAALARTGHTCARGAIARYAGGSIALT